MIVDMGVGGWPTSADQAIIDSVGRYYTEKLRLFGATPRGVDWSSAESQALRFDKLLAVVEDDREASLNDFGCGYGALVEHLTTAGRRFVYCGFDISELMITRARARFGGISWCTFISDATCLCTADYTVASGIFNVKLDYKKSIWQEYVVNTLDTLDRLSARGFAFNMLSTYSDADKQRDELYYADPRETFDLCKRRFSPRVSLLHDYPLYEFTMLVTK